MLEGRLAYSIYQGSRLLEERVRSCYSWVQNYCKGLCVESVVPRAAIFGGGVSGVHGFMRAPHQWVNLLLDL